MQQDLHFYAIAVLARAAGFKEKEALDIAYASQYVDDSTEGDTIPVGDILFDPVRTAHYGLKAYDWDVQKCVYIPFHFLPRQSAASSSRFYSTACNSDFAKAVFTRACSETDEKLRLIAIGIALHTMADTWSHEGFSGRHDSENDVEAISLWNGGKWSRQFFDNIFLDFLPVIGHAQAGNFPDMPFVKWRCQLGKKAGSMQRDNTKSFMQAIDTIYDLLKAVSGNPPRPDWDDIRNSIKACLCDERELEQRCSNWASSFAFLFPTQKLKYSVTAWRAEALKPSDPNMVAWDASGRSQFARMKYTMTKGFWSSRWVLFHKAALRQRHFVLERLQ